MIDRSNYTQINSSTWDAWVDGGIDWSIPVSHEELEEAKRGNWGIYLSASRTVPHDWFPNLAGARVLGLASGGGQQMPVLSVLGARCTVFDYSQRQLELERMVAQREGYGIELIQGDMTKPLPFEDQTFDLIFHPVSNCYIEDVQHVWDECYRVLKPGGVLLAGLDNGMNFLFGDNTDTLPLTAQHKLPYNPLRDASQQELERMAENQEGIQFSHTMEEQVGGQLKAGFRLTHLLEDRDREGTGYLREYVPQYIMTRSIKEG